MKWMNSWSHILIKYISLLFFTSSYNLRLRECRGVSLRNDYCLCETDTSQYIVGMKALEAISSPFMVDGFSQNNSMAVKFKKRFL